MADSAINDMVRAFFEKCGYTPSVEDIATVSARAASVIADEGAKIIAASKHG